MITAAYALTGIGVLLAIVVLWVIANRYSDF